MRRAGGQSGGKVVTPSDVEYIGSEDDQDDLKYDVGTSWGSR